MTVITSQSTIVAEDAAVKLARYAAVIQNPECSFWGVNNPAEPTNGECRPIWSKAQRDNILKYLAEAQLEIENIIGYFLSPRYVVGKLADEPNGNDRYVDEQPIPCGWKVMARWPKVIELGQRATATVALAAVVNHAADPAIVGPIATAITDPDEIHVYHPGTDVEIDPSSITIAGGNVTISIPRCRMVLAADADNPDVGWDYSDLSHFEATVDVKRIYTDPSVNAVLTWETCCNSGVPCSQSTQTACLYIDDAALGQLAVRPAAYSGGAWAAACMSVCAGFKPAVQLYYLAGAKALSTQAEDAIIRLAHAKMPEEPCGCEVSQRMWKRDREIPEVLTRERINCPFGLAAGSWVSWRFAQSPGMRVWRAGVL